MAIKGIKASQNNTSCEEINDLLKKLESTKFACLGNNSPSNSTYNIPDYKDEKNRKNWLNFWKIVLKMWICCKAHQQ